MDIGKNKDVFLNFGLIAAGRLSEIEKLQRLIKKDFKDLKVVYCTVTAKRLFLRKIGVSDNYEREEEESIEVQEKTRRT